jgi:hypothetical protein
MQSGWTVILIVGLDSMDERHLIDMIGNIREQLRDISAGFSMLCELEGTANDRVGKCQSALKLASYRRQPRQGLAVQIVQNWLVFERVHLADTALHEQKDAILCLASQMRRLGRERVAECSCFIGHQATERQCADAVVSL